LRGTTAVVSIEKQDLRDEVGNTTRNAAKMVGRRLGEFEEFIM
jgi:hypothetical protein